jgi:hypothetical protein
VKARRELREVDLFSEILIQIEAHRIDPLLIGNAADRLYLQGGQNPCVTCTPRYDGRDRFVSMGIDWPNIPLNFTWSLGMNTMLTAKERHAVLYTIQQGLMPKKTGKQYEWQVAVDSANPLQP